jgi:hypothetical protein
MSTFPKVGPGHPDDVVDLTARPQRPPAMHPYIAARQNPNQHSPVSSLDLRERINPSYDSVVSTHGAGTIGPARSYEGLGSMEPDIAFRFTNGLSDGYSTEHLGSARNTFQAQIAGPSRIGREHPPVTWDPVDDALKAGFVHGSAYQPPVRRFETTVAANPRTRANPAEITD